MQLRRYLADKTNTKMYFCSIPPVNHYKLCQYLEIIRYEQYHSTIIISPLTGIIGNYNNCLQTDFHSHHPNVELGSVKLSVVYLFDPREEECLMLIIAIISASRAEISSPHARMEQLEHPGIREGHGFPGKCSVYYTDYCSTCMLSH